MCSVLCYYFHVIYLQHYLSSISQLPQHDQKSHNNMPRSTSGRRSGGSGRRSGGSGRGKLSTRRSTLLNYFFGRRDEEDEIPLTDLHNRTKEDLMGLMKDEDGQYKPEGMENVADDLLVAIDENKRLNAEITELNSANEDLVVTNTSLLDTITKNAKLSKRMAVLGFVVVLAGEFEFIYKRNFPVLDRPYETRANQNCYIPLDVSFIPAVGITFGVTYVSTNSNMEHQTTEVKQAVENSDKTDVTVGVHGEALLTDQKTGKEVSTRSTGDEVEAVRKLSPSGQQVMCMAISDVALLYNDAVTRTFTSVEFVDENGEVSRVLPLNGEFQDQGNTLHFGPTDATGVGMKVILDSDACSMLPLNGTDQVDPSLVEEDDAIEVPLNDTSPVDLTVDEEGQYVDPQPFKRRLRHPLKARKSPNDLLATNRLVFSKAKVAVREGRKLQDDEDTSVVVEVDDSGSFVGGLPCTDPYVDGSNLADSILDVLFSPLETSGLDTLDTPGGDALSIAEWLKDQLSDAIGDLTRAVLLPQKICSNAEEDLATRGGNAGVEACEALDMLGET